MALLSLTNGLAWRNSGETPGYQVAVPANFGTLGGLAGWRKKVYIARNETPIAADPRRPAYNLLAAATFQATANKSTSPATATATPSASVVYPAASGAALAK